MSDTPMPRIERPLRLGTRGSPLALWQARWVAERIEAAGRAVALEIVKTTAEKFPEKALTGMGAGIFTAELDAALLEGRIDLAVHSLKDVPSTIHRELTIAAVPERESPWDAFLSRDGTPLDNLPRGARLGTSSPRRQAQLWWRRPDLEMVPLRGNVQTRLRKVEEQGLAGTVLAHAGLRRLGQEDLITHLLEAEVLVPAVAQGALGVVTRAGDRETRGIVAALDHRTSRVRVEAERAYLRRLRGGCQVPAGALAEHDPRTGEVRMVAVLAAPDGSRLLRREGRGAADQAETLGERLADEILAEGGDGILAEMLK
jgi:hydroxymethylbilane synthase